jgi:uncharacterized protein with GYD domain
MVHFAYTSQAWAALAKKPEDRSEPVSALAQKFGGRLIDLYYHFGDYDGVVILEAPDDSTALAWVIAVHAPGHLKTTKTTRLFTVAETMESMRKAGTVAYPGPAAASR